MKLCGFSFCILAVAEDADVGSLLQLRSLKKKAEEECLLDRTCIVAGDPHIRTFDARVDGDRTNCYGPMGDYYLVKTDKLQVAARYIGKPPAESSEEINARVGGVVITGALVNDQTISIPAYAYKDLKQAYSINSEKIPKLVTSDGTVKKIRCAPFPTWQAEGLGGLTPDQCRSQKGPCLKYLRYKEWEKECTPFIVESEGVTVTYGEGANALRILKEANGLAHDESEVKDNTYTINLKEGVTVVVNQGAMQHVAINTPNKMAISTDGEVAGHCGNYDCDFTNDKLEAFSCSDPVNPFEPCSADGAVSSIFGKHDNCGVEPAHKPCSTIQFREFRPICEAHFAMDQVADLNNCIDDCCQDREECPDKDFEDQFAHCTMTGDPHIKTFNAEGPNSNIFWPHGDFNALASDALTVQVRYSSGRADQKAQVMGVAMTGPLVGDELEDGSYPVIEIPLLKSESSSTMLLNGESKIQGNWTKCEESDCSFETDFYKATFGYGFAVNQYNDGKYQVRRLGDGWEDVNYVLDENSEKLEIDHFAMKKTLTIEFKHGNVENVAKVVVNNGGTRQNMMIEVRGNLLGESSELSGHCVVPEEKCTDSAKAEKSLFAADHPSADIGCPEVEEKICEDEKQIRQRCRKFHKGLDKVWAGEQTVKEVIEACVVDCCGGTDCPPEEEPETFEITTTTTTHEPYELWDPLNVSTCMLTGDPHIKTFDRKRKDKHFYRYGDYWIVESPLIWIQARYWSSRTDGKSTIRAVAISEPWHGGKQMVMNPQNMGGFQVIGGDVLKNKKCQYNDRDSTHERLFRHSGVQTINDCQQFCEADFKANATCQYFSYSDINGDSSHPGVCMGCTDIENMDEHTGFSVYERETFQSGFVNQMEQPLVTGGTVMGSKHLFTFPWAEHVQVTVFDFGHFMNLFIEMPRLQLGQMSGHCGNFDTIDNNDEPGNEMVVDDDLLFKAHLWNVVLPNDKCPEARKVSAMSYCAQKVTEEDVLGDMEDCVIDCCDSQSIGGECSLADLSLAGERDWKAQSIKAKAEAKAAAHKAKQEAVANKNAAIKAKQDAMKERAQPADGSCGNCYNSCHKIKSNNKHCRNKNVFWYKLCPGACGRSPVVRDGVRSCQGDAEEDKCPPLQQ